MNEPPRPAPGTAAPLRQGQIRQPCPKPTGLPGRCGNPLWAVTLRENPPGGRRWAGHGHRRTHQRPLAGSVHQSRHQWPCPLDHLPAQRAMHHLTHPQVRGPCHRRRRCALRRGQQRHQGGCDASRQHQDRRQRGQAPRDRRPQPGREPWRNTPPACPRLRRVPASQGQAAPRRQSLQRPATPGPPGPPGRWWTPRVPPQAQPPQAGEPPAQGRREPEEVVVAPPWQVAALRWTGPGVGVVGVAALAVVRSWGQWWGPSMPEGPRSGRQRAAQAPPRKQGPRQPLHPRPGGNAHGEPTDQPAGSQGAGIAPGESRSTRRSATQHPPLRPRPTFSAGAPGTTSWFGHPPWSAAGLRGHAGSAPRAAARP